MGLLFGIPVREFPFGCIAIPWHITGSNLFSPCFFDYIGRHVHGIVGKVQIEGLIPFIALYKTNSFIGKDICGKAVLVGNWFKLFIALPFSFHQWTNDLTTKIFKLFFLFISINIFLTETDIIPSVMHETEVFIKTMHCRHLFLPAGKVGLAIFCRGIPITA